MLEKDIERPVCAYAKSFGWQTDKFTSPNKRSVPDRLMSPVNRPIFFMEFKAPGKVPTEAQARDHKARRDNGQTVFVVDNVAFGKQIVDLVELGVDPGMIKI